ncbi:MAG: prolyl oligopeptidase family serine peptidase [Myxococcota bacterium]|nr:prolyl oligopeptidase family serine peptidase [Myxococcota bacterium]
MRLRLALTAALASVVFLCACGQAPALCPSSADGTCDVPRVCALGTDSADCDAWCADSDLPLLRAPCAHDEASRLRQEELEGLDAVGSGGQGGPVGTWDGVIEARGAASGSRVDRHYRVHVPSSYDPDNPSPMLFVLGGFQVDLYFLPGYTELDRSAGLSDVIVVYLQPEWRYFGNSIGWVFAWYVYDNAWSGGWDDNPDLDFMEQLAEHLGSLYNVDRSRTLVSGHSRGAALSVIATLELPDLFSGFCAQAGFVAVNDYDLRMAELEGQQPGAGYIIHGDMDPDVSVNQSDYLVDQLESLGWAEGEHFEYLRLEDVTHFWQPQYNEDFIEFLLSRPLGEDLQQ